MARGQDDPSDSDDGTILSPDELDITQDEHVAELDDGRFVVSPNDPIGDVSTGSQNQSRSHPTDTVDDAGREPGAKTDPTHQESADNAQPAADEQPAQQRELDDRQVHEWLEQQFEQTNSRYGFDVTAKFDGSIRQRHMVSNDVVTIFESLMLWYAQQIDSTTPVEEILGILLMESNVPIQYQPASLQNLLERTDLTPEDSIADLVETVSEDEGFRL
jgi:hypothetical protein